MSILKAITSVSNSAARYFYRPSVNNSTGELLSSSGLTDILSGQASDASLSNETLSFSIEDADGHPVSGPIPLGTHTVPSTDAATGAIFDNYYNATDLADGLHGVFYTTPTTSRYSDNDLTSLKFETFGDAGDLIEGPRSLSLGTGTSVKNLVEAHVGTIADHGNSFVVGYTTYDPKAHTGQLRYERFDEDGNAIAGGVMRTFNDASRHGLDFGSFYSADNPNNGGQSDYMLINRANNSQSKVQVMLADTDMNPLASKTIQLTGPSGQKASAIDKYDYLRPGLADAENFGALSETYRYVDALGKTHEEIAIQAIDPQTLQVRASTKFEVLSGTQTGVDLEHLSNGDILAVYNDGGQSYAKAFNASLHQVGAAFALPHDNDGYDAVTDLGNDQFRIDWRSTSGTAASGPTTKHTAIFQA